jgi:hypothetical protein
VFKVLEVIVSNFISRQWSLCKWLGTGWIKINKWLPSCGGANLWHYHHFFIILSEKAYSSPLVHWVHGIDGPSQVSSPREHPLQIQEKPSCPALQPKSICCIKSTLGPLPHGPFLDPPPWLDCLSAGLDVFHWYIFLRGSTLIVELPCEPNHGSR